MKRQAEQKDVGFFLFLPRQIETDKQYIFNQMRLITSVSTISPFMNGKPSKIPILQVALWQKIDGVDTQFKLVVEEGRGVIYWSGLNAWPGKYSFGETCVLQSKKGFFSDIEIKPIVLSSDFKKID